ncbi:metal-dependent transcriptional regulator [Candidatus Omnitrophota bacterium]
MEISDRAQEILEKYWLENKEKKKDWKMEVVSDDPIALELEKGDFARRETNHISLTKKGWDEARSCVRRHRLAESLLSDVLYIRKNRIRDLGCKFEHLLQKNVEENICTLLGHPKTCPHGKPIPEGGCCHDLKRSPKKLVFPLSECEAKDKVRIAYIKTHSEAVMNKLTSMGIIPGLTIRLLSRRPTFLFQMGESQFAIDKILASKIQVRPIR